MATHDDLGSAPRVPPEASPSLWRLTRLARRPLERFLRVEAASAIVLVGAAAFALVWANSPWAGGYAHLLETPIGVRVGGLALERPLEWVVDDGLMAIFFFVIGMEIRREIDHGELSDLRRAALPVAAAIGGMLAPAGLYLAVAGGPGSWSGWGVPMATDIAFALGVLTLLGRRVPPALRLLLLAVAVIDDVGAILVIALYYSTGVSAAGLLLAAVGLGGVLLMQRLGVRVRAAYVAPAVVAWAGAYLAGVHPTIAGVAVGLLTPVRAWLGPEGFAREVQVELDRVAEYGTGEVPVGVLSGILRRVDAARREALSPVDSLVERLHPWVAYAIMPIFALTNAGVAVPRGPIDAASGRILAGVVVGLLVGKPLGVVLATWLAARLGVATLPAGLGFRHVLVLGLVAGVGFTMALFVAPLAFTAPDHLAAAKLGVLLASAAAAVVALVAGSALLERSTEPAS